MPWGSDEILHTLGRPYVPWDNDDASFLNTGEARAGEKSSVGDAASDAQMPEMGIGNDAALIAIDGFRGPTLPMSVVLEESDFANISVSTSIPSSISSSGDVSLEEAMLDALQSLPDFNEVPYDGLEGVPLLFEPSHIETQPEQRSQQTSRAPGVAVPRLLGAICPECSQTFVTSSCLK